MLNPSVPFTELTLHPGRATEMVNSMNENQLRYAMWATLCILFGDPRSNADECVIANWPPRNPAAAGPTLLLAQIGVGISHNAAVKDMERDFADMKK